VIEPPTSPKDPQKQNATNGRGQGHNQAAPGCRRRGSVSCRPGPQARPPAGSLGWLLGAGRSRTRGLLGGLRGQARIAAAPHRLQLLSDIELQSLGDAPGLGDHEHRFGQPLQVCRLKRLELFDTDVQPLGEGFGGQPP